MRYQLCKRWVMAGILMIAVSGMSGCMLAIGNSSHGTSGSAASSTQLKKLFDSSNLVGGGFNVHYVAPSDGTVYLVQADASRIMETKSLKKGETYTFDMQSKSPKDTIELFGEPLSQVKLLLYFVPQDQVQMHTF